jgi:hypothetical protein
VAAFGDGSLLEVIMNGEEAVGFLQRYDG